MGYYGERVFGWAVTLFAFVLIIGLGFWDHDHGWPICHVIWSIISIAVDPVIRFVEGFKL